MDAEEKKLLLKIIDLLEEIDDSIIEGNKFLAEEIKKKEMNYYG